MWKGGGEGGIGTILCGGRVVVVWFAVSCAKWCLRVVEFVYARSSMARGDHSPEVAQLRRSAKKPPSKPKICLCQGDVNLSLTVEGSVR